MKLNQEQLNYIDRFLNKMELFHVDLRNEVLDHMATSVEDYMATGFSFKDALDRVCEDWIPELRSYQSFWLGLLWQGPKILIEECVLKTKRLYLKSALVTIVVCGFFFGIRNTLSSDVLATMNISIGTGYLLFFSVLVVLRYKIKKTDFQTSFSFLFKVHAIAFSFLFVLYNPLFSDMFSLVKNNSIDFVATALHGFTLIFSSFFLKFYRGHMKSEKQQLA